jgi:hypothetical protein
MAKHPKRPKDSAALAKLVVAIASGDTPDDSEPMRQPPNAGAARRGEARAKALSPKRRSTIAKKAAKARWSKRGRD